ncbi:MAG: right-handed parallel beta-helix repeat-containing protein [Gilvibacter sp.]
MRLKKSKIGSFGLLTLLLASVLIVVLAVAFLLDQKTVNPKKEAQINAPTQIELVETSIKDIILNKVGQVYSDSLVNIHIITQTGVSEILHIYKEKGYPEVLTDNFSLMFVLKDSTKALDGRDRVQLYYPPDIPENVNINGRRFIVFRKKMISPVYEGEYMDINKIKIIHSARHVGGVASRYSIRDIEINKIWTTPVPLKKVVISIDQKDFEKIKTKRAGALKNGVLESFDEDLVSVKIMRPDSSVSKANMRLKGDWTQHLEDPLKWSFRIIMDGDQTYQGMRKFSLQAPVTRNYAWEWLFQKVNRDHDIVSLRYDFVDLDLEIKTDQGIVKRPIGIMAVEESFDKILIENNRRREGLILALDEKLSWGEVEKAFHLGLGRTPPNTQGNRLVSSIRAFNQNKVLEDPKLSKQFEVAKNLIEGLRYDKYKISEVYDLEKLTTFVALSNLFAGSHGFWEFNLRFYYNPISNKLEPVCFDSNSGGRIQQVDYFPFSREDPVYQELLLEKLKMVSNEAFISAIFEKYDPELEQIIDVLKTEFDFTLDRSRLEYNSAMIKQYLNPDTAITANLVTVDDATATLQITNISQHTLLLDGIAHKDGRVLSKRVKIPIKANAQEIVTVDLNRYFVNAFVSKKNKVGEFRFPKDVSKLMVTYHIPGVNIARTCEVLSFTKNIGLDESMAKTRAMFKANYKEFDFVNETEEAIVFKAGSYEVSKNIVVPKGKELRIEPGFKLNLTNNASLYAFTDVFAHGVKTKPIIITSDGTGGGVFIAYGKNKTLIDGCEFINLSNPKMHGWELSGAVNIYDTEVSISNSLFAKNRCEDGLNIIRSDFTIDGSTFKDTQSDAFDGDFVNGSITNSSFVNSGNDGIDVSGSQISLDQIEIFNPSDKGISGGEASAITGKDIKISGGEIGIVSKDLSKVTLDDITIEDTRLGLSAFQKKTEYGIGAIEITNLTLLNIEVEHLIENKSLCTIDGVAVQTVSNNVIDQMYGAEYGKSSR